ncbi:choice-of-anchor tandem repeat GloVer-containing protein [Ferruginibacter profundus]
MKKFTLSVVMFLLLTATTMAQGVSKLFGLVGGSPQSNQQSNGFLFSTDSSGQNFQLKYDFPVTTYGANPANLELVPYNGKLYGTTYQGGVNNYGTIFEYDPATNTYTKKFDFGPNVSQTGGGPKGSLLLYNNKFYGLAADYGVSGAGVIFEWDPATNVYNKKFDLTGGGGASPQNSLRLMNGKMYGTTSGGGASGLGVVFEWDPATNAYTKLLDLNGIGAGTNGWSFYNNVTPYNNKLYCTTVRGGLNDYGTLLMIDPSLPIGSNSTIIKNLDAASGGNGSNNEMIVYNNKLYGCLYAGGSSGAGTLFELNPAGNIFTKLFDFDYTATGDQPQGKLVLNGTRFLGLCTRGGANGTGTVYEWDPANPTTVVKKYSFLTNNYDNTINPGSTLALFNSKFYAVSYNGGYVNQGNLFEYDYTLNTVTKKKTFNAAENGRIPYGKPVLLNGKIYGICYQGPQEIFGTPYGCLWSFDPSSSVYSRKFLFDYPGNAINGRAPVSAPVAYNGKLYGTTINGGTSDLGVLYEYDPATDGYTKKDMQPIAGSFPVGEPAVYNNKLYGMTNANGIGNNGIIYSYDPASGVLSKVYDVQNGGSLSPNGAFTVYNNKLYGTTSGGGANNFGGVLVFDPGTNTATTPASFSSAGGVTVSNAPTLYNNKFYLMAYSGGANGRGSILQFDPATNVLTTVYSFSTNAGGNGYDPNGGLTVNGNYLYAVLREANNINVIQLDPATNTVTTRSSYTPASNYNMPSAHNSLTVVPAFIANGTPGSCETYPTVVINSSNNNQWVPILNTAGDVVAEIKANGNNLGNVNASTYVNNTAVREDPIKRLYMDRNITITVQNQPSSNVDIRLYVKTSEFLALKNATNSAGQPSGISTISDVAIFKNEQTCNGALTQNAAKLATATSAYEYGYVLSASISSFSTFFFAKNTFTALPLTFINFDAVKQEHDVKLNWATENEINLANFQVEKSNNAGNFTAIGTIAAKGNASQNNYTITDSQPFAGVNYYRLKATDKNSAFRYSGIVKVDFSKKYTINILPNPAQAYITITGADAFKQIQVIDVTGKVVKQMNKELTNRYNISGINKGVYIIKLINGQETIAGKIVIE